MMGPPTGARAAEAPERLKVLRDLPSLYAILAYLVHGGLGAADSPRAGGERASRVHVTYTFLDEAATVPYCCY